MPRFLPGDKVRLRGLSGNPPIDGWVAGSFPNMVLYRRSNAFAQSSYEHGELVLFMANGVFNTIGDTGWKSNLVTVAASLLAKIGPNEAEEEGLDIPL